MKSAEWCARGHPDKVCDQISDAILDAYLTKDPYARVDVSCAISHTRLFIMGEVTSTATVDIADIAKKTIAEIGYEPSQFTLMVEITTQSDDIKNGIGDFGAGDQAIVVGYATDETPEYMPLPVIAGRNIMQNLGATSLGPDGKCLVTTSHGKIKTIIVSCQHKEESTLDDVRKQIEAAIPPEYLEDRPQLFLNPAGRFVLGGPFADTGLTGKKIIVDCYGTAAHHGGGAFSGKDPTKVDRSGAYMARYIAKNIVAKGLAKEIEVTLYYIIGQNEALGITLNANGTEKIPLEEIKKQVVSSFDISVQGIITTLHLRRPIYASCAWRGHFGRSEPTYKWESVVSF